MRELIPTHDVRIIEVLNDLKDEEPAELWYRKTDTDSQPETGKTVGSHGGTLRTGRGIDRISAKYRQIMGKFLNFFCFSLQINDLRRRIFLDFCFDVS